MSIDEDINDIIFLLRQDKERRDFDYKRIIELLAKIRKAYEQNLQVISDDGSNGTRPENWQKKERAQ